MSTIEIAAKSSPKRLNAPRKVIKLLDDEINLMDKDRLIAKEPSIDELLSSGVINLNKPMGPTSHQVSAWVKNIFHADKLGHGGTLDPRVTGVLPLAFGRGTRLLSIFKYAPKEHVGVMRLHQNLPQKKVEHVCSNFVGEIYQFPPVRSAVKRQLRVRTIYSLDILEQAKRDILFKVSCEAGTYIRSLVHDIGLVLGSGAHMQELRRTKSGMFSEDDSVTLHDLKDAHAYWQEDGDESLLKQYIQPMEVLLNALPKFVIADSAVDAICHGADLAIPGIVQFDDVHRVGEPVAIVSRFGEGVAVGEVLMDTNQIKNAKSGLAVKTTRVLMPTGTYKKGWKSKSD